MNTRNYTQTEKVINYQSRKIEEICNGRADTVLLPSSAIHFCWKLSHGAQSGSGAEDGHGRDLQGASLLTAVRSCAGAGKGYICTKGLQALRSEDVPARFIRHAQKENSDDIRYTN